MATEFLGITFFVYERVRNFVVFFICLVRQFNSQNRNSTIGGQRWNNEGITLGLVRLIRGTAVETEVESGF